MKWKVILAGFFVFVAVIGFYQYKSNNQLAEGNQIHSDIVIKDFLIQQTFTDKDVEVQIKEAKEYYLDKSPFQLYPVKEKVIEEYSYQGENFETQLELIWPFTKLVFSVTNKGSTPLFCFSERDKHDYDGKKDKLQWIPVSYLLSDRGNPAPVQYYKQFFPSNSYIDTQGLLPGQTIEIHAYYLFPPMSNQLSLVLPTLRWKESNDLFVIQAPFTLTDKPIVSRQPMSGTIPDKLQGGL
jgi:hypothetical protein